MMDFGGSYPKPPHQHHRQPHPPQQQQQVPGFSHSHTDLKSEPSLAMRGQSLPPNSPGMEAMRVQQSPTPAPSAPEQYPPNHPLSGSKHFCSICGDRASGKHYGVYSCEGCKGFFKRTVRKELTYVCREIKECVIDKRQRNRCQYCRYMKCLNTGMRREAVQDERNRSAAGGGGGSMASGIVGETMSSNSADDVSGDQSNGPMEVMAIDRIVEAESFMMEKNVFCDEGRPTKAGILRSLINWAKKIPFFRELKHDDQVSLIREGWNELLIAGFSYKSMDLKPEGIRVGEGMIITKQEAHMAGVGEIFDRVIVELVQKMKDMSMDLAELGCLRAIVLFNPDARNLDPTVSPFVENLREKVYATLELYCRTRHGSEVSRFAKLLLRLPALRSIGLKCMEHFFFYKLIKEDGGPFNNGVPRMGDQGMPDGLNNANPSPIDTFILNILGDDTQ